MQDKELFEEIDNILQEKTEEKKENNTNKRRKINFVLVFGVIVVILLTNCILNILTNNDYNYEEDEEYKDYIENYSGEYDSFYDYRENKIKEEFKLQKDNININSYVTSEKLICEIFNSNTEDVKNMTLYVIYYDKEKNPISIDLTNIEYIYAKKYFYCDLNIDSDYDSYDFLLTKDYENGTKAVSLDNIELSEVESDDKYSNKIILKNKSGYKIDRIEVCIIYYYDNGEIYNIEKRYGYDIGVNGKQSISFYNFDEEIKNYKIVINNAFYYEK